MTPTKVRTKSCLWCGARPGDRPPGLCARCHADPVIRSFAERPKLPRRKAPTGKRAGRPEVPDALTAAELDAMVAERMADLPPWWVAEEAALLRAGTKEHTVRSGLRVVRARAGRYTPAQLCVRV